MRFNFESALGRVLVHEGGWADHPKDPGGATMKGVTLMTFRRYFGEDMGRKELLNITKDQLGLIYREGYWDQCCCDHLPSGLDYAVFDAAVNSGPRRSAKWLQQAVGATPDGVIGEKTLSLVPQLKPESLIVSATDFRTSFLTRLRTWAFFGKGWTRRIDGVRVGALALATPRNMDNDFRTMLLGMTGSDVMRLQRALCIDKTGDFDVETEKYVESFQVDCGLIADGIAGRRTCRALGILD